MSARRKIDLDLAKRMAAAGVTHREIAKYFGASPRSVSVTLCKAKFSTRAARRTAAQFMAEEQRA